FNPIHHGSGGHGHGRWPAWMIPPWRIAGGGGGGHYVDPPMDYGGGEYYPGGSGDYSGSGDQGGGSDSGGDLDDMIESNNEAELPERPAPIQVAGDLSDLIEVPKKWFNRITGGAKKQDELTDMKIKRNEVIWQNRGYQNIIGGRAQHYSNEVGVEILIDPELPATPGNINTDALNHPSISEGDAKWIRGARAQMNENKDKIKDMNAAIDRKRLQNTVDTLKKETGIE
ncbi:hypothetical protein ACFL2Q_15955, partial [Thermodesulfobacteriota bacterium]